MLTVNGPRTCQNEKYFQECKLTKEALISGVDSLVNSFSNKREMSATNDLPLSVGTLTRRVQDASNGLQRQLNSDVNICSWDALKMDEITGHIKAQMAIVKQ
jgi:hypothetical protein